MQKYSKFFDEIFTSTLLVTPEAMVKYYPYLLAISKGQVLTLPDKPVLKMSIFDDMLNPCNNDDDKEMEGVAVITISGVLTRSGSWWDYGTEDIAAMFEDAFENDAIKAIVARVNSPGGTVDSIFPMKAIMAKKNKPCLAAVDNIDMSSAYYISSFFDSINAIDPMCQVGSIGVMADIPNYDEMYKQMGIKLIRVTPPESNWKNKAITEAQKGNPELLISEELTPWATHFQETVKTNRPNVNPAVEGTLNGRTFFANYGEINAKMNGLIDNVMPFDEIIQLAFNKAQNQQIKSLFNS